MDAANKLWMGDVRLPSCNFTNLLFAIQLESYMDEAFLMSVFAQFGYHIQSVRWNKNYQTGCCCRFEYINSELAVYTFLGLLLVTAFWNSLMEL